MSKVTEFNRPSCRIVSERVTEALKELGEELGITFSHGGGKFSTETFTIKLEASLLNEDGSASSKEAEDFKSLADVYGLKATDLEATITINGKRVIIKGLKPRSHKYPVIGQDIGTGKRFKYPVDSVLAALGRKTKSDLPVFG